MYIGDGSCTPGWCDKGKIADALFSAENAVQKVGERYDYKVEYVSTIGEGSPRTRSKMSLIELLSNHYKVAPEEAYYVAKLVVSDLNNSQRR